MYTNFVKLDYIEFLILRNWEQSYLWSSGIGPLVEWNLACADGEGALVLSVRSNDGMPTIYS